MRPFLTASFRLSIASLLFTGITVQPTTAAEPDSSAVNVADSSTYVSIAKVNLSVGTMSVAEGDLVGTYSIDVPLRKSKSEDGQITLPLEQPLEHYLRDGGTLSGKGVSAMDSEDGNRRIEARFSPYDAKSQTGRIHLTIETSLRTLEFDSTYTLSGAEQPVSE
jgi:hypothetical protein